MVPIRSENPEGNDSQTANKRYVTSAVERTQVRVLTIRSEHEGGEGGGQTRERVAVEP